MSTTNIQITSPGISADASNPSKVSTEVEATLVTIDVLQGGVQLNTRGGLVKKISDVVTILEVSDSYLDSMFDLTDDSLGFLESLSASIQSYFAEDYVEPTYAGEIRTL